MNKNINIKQNLESKAIKSLQKASLTGIFLLVFFAIVREGFETALILIGSNQSDTFSFLGFFGGILAALLVGVLIFWRGKKINLKTFFNFTSALLIFFAAGMIAYGTHEIEEFLVKSGNLDEDSVSRVWNILTPISEDKSSSIFYTYNEIKEISYHSLHDKGSIGVFMKGLFGYNSNPNYIEFFLWLISLTGGLYFLKRNK